MDDYIGRQAAIDALHMDTSIIPFKKAREYADATISEIRNRLEKLPAVQPQQVTGKLNVDCISRQMMIDGLASIAKAKAKSDAQKSLMGRIIFFTEHLPSAQPQRWIPVTEALPEDACQCIVTAKVKHVDNYPDYEVDTADFADGIFTTANSWWGVESIIAWMPLPEPYAERRQDG